LTELLTFFYHNSADFNKKIQDALSGNFIDPEAEVLFIVPIVERKSRVTDSSIPYEISRIIGLRPGYDYPNKSKVSEGTRMSLGKLN
jgi:hypothetical protein